MASKVTVFCKNVVKSCGALCPIFFLCLQGSVHPLSFRIFFFFFPFVSQMLFLFVPLFFLFPLPLFFYFSFSLIFIIIFKYTRRIFYTYVFKRPEKK